jgi:hypothetical protein
MGLREMEVGSTEWVHLPQDRDQDQRRVLVNTAKPEGNSLLGRPRHKWEDNIKIDAIEME